MGPNARPGCVRQVQGLDRLREGVRDRGRAINAALPGWETDLCPLTDGGEGFARILTRAAGGTISACEVTDPWGRRSPRRLASCRSAGYGAGPPRGSAGPKRKPGGPCDHRNGLGKRARPAPAGMRDPMRASSAGTGQLIRAAGAAGARAILLGVGGSATHDLGLGALGALGVEFVGASGEALCGLVPADWGSIAGDRRARAWDEVPQILIACDVENPLLGPRGAGRLRPPERPQARGRCLALEANPHG
jgi:glycerate 2-kinase